MKKENKFIKFAIPAIAVLLSISVSLLCITFICSAATGEEFNMLSRAIGVIVIGFVVILFYLYLFVCAYSWFMDNIKKDWYQYYLLRAKYPNKTLRSAYCTYNYSLNPGRLKYVLLFRLRNINDVKKRKNKEAERIIKRLNGYGGF